MRVPVLFGIFTLQPQHTMIELRITNLPDFDKSIKRLAKKAKRLDLLEPTYEIIESKLENVDIKITGEDGFIRKTGEKAEMLVHLVRIQNTQPIKFNGWSFVASLETLHNGQNIVYEADKEVRCPTKFFQSGSRCEHCNQERSRTRTYVVMKDNVFKQVGSSCLVDFVGNANAERIAQTYAFYGELLLLEQSWNDSLGMGPHEIGFAVEQTVARTIAVIEKYGWVSRRKAEEEQLVPTSQTIQNKEILAQLEVTETHKLLAEAIVTYFRDLNLTAEEASSYILNLSTFAKAGYHTQKGFGIVASMPVAYEKIKQEEKRKEDTVVSNHIGEIGQRIQFEGVVQLVHRYYGHYGLDGFTVVRTKEGNLIKAKELGAQKGDTVSFVGTIAEHGEYNGQKQTKVLRAKNIVITNATDSIKTTK